MCGIVGFVGNSQAAPILLDGLSKLEYRGYDSAGIAVKDGKNPIKIIRTVGKLKNLQTATFEGKSILGSVGIGHTRWATHGEPSVINAHPHTSNSEEDFSEPCVTGVHNGIIENHAEIREKLISKGYKFYSTTDTEAVIKLVDYYYKKYNIGPVDAIAKAMVRVRGSYALLLMFADYPGEIWAARKDSPMIIGVAEDESYIASDVPAILKHTRDVYYIGNLEMARITAGNAEFFNLNGDKIEKEITHIEYSVADAQKGGFAHFMLKEIYEQPTAIKNTLGYLTNGDKIDLSACGIDDESLRGINEITVVACGSAWHVGCVFKCIVEKLAKIRVNVSLSSEFRYKNPIFTEKSLVVAISQSGETADTLAAVRLAKSLGIKTLGIVNTVGSSLERECDYTVHTKAGPEISVATTKAYSAQLTAGYALALKLASVKHKIVKDKYKKLVKALLDLPEKVRQALKTEPDIQKLAGQIQNCSDVFFIGRGIDYAVGLEGSLKLKEICYIHSEGYAAGELKHGTLSLVCEGTPIICLITQSEVAEKTYSNSEECRSRGGFTVGVTSDKFSSFQFDYNVSVPDVEEIFSASVEVIPLQLLGYYTSVARGIDVDKPRNLAKSVTVE